MPFPPRACPSPWALQIWNASDGQIEWNALEMLGELYGVEDMDILIHELLTIRAFLRARER